MKIQIKIESSLGTIEGALDLTDSELTWEEDAISSLEWVKNLLNATTIAKIDWSQFE